MNFGRILLIVLGVMALVTAGAGILMSTTDFQVKTAVTGKFFDSSKPVYYDELGSDSTNPAKLKAMVKGSIYETGEYMTVYGACFDGMGVLIPGSTATFDSWFNNGTQWQNNESMTPILDDLSSPTGRFLISVNMHTQSGTYLTQITCHYMGDEAIAFGEWQNPDWVRRIGTIQGYVNEINQTSYLIYDAVNNVSSQINDQTTTILTAISVLENLTTEHYSNLTTAITDFRSEVQSNFSTTINILNNISQSGDISHQQTAAVYDLVHSLDYCYWVLDTSDPYYTGTGNTYDFKAVDMSSEDNAWAVTTSGDIASYNGTAWSSVNYAGYSWYGVSALEANTNYAWIVGTNGSNCFYSINKAPPVEITGTAATTCYDIAAFYTPTLINAYVIGDNGDIIRYNGTDWNVIGSTGETGSAKMDMLKDNTALFIAQGDEINVVTVATDAVTGYQASGATFVDVSAVYVSTAYAISSESPWKVYKLENGVFTTDFTATGAVSTPVGIKAHNQFDVWVVTSTPGAYYKYDGKQWSFAEYPYSSFVSIMIGFNVSMGMSMQDINMFTEKAGYAVGDNGMIMKYSCHYDERFDQVMNVLSNLTCGGGGDNLCVELCRNLTNITLAMNASIMNEFNNLNSYLVNMNTTMIARFDTLDLALLAFQTDVNASFLNINTLLSDLNYTVNFRFDNVDSMLTTIDGKIDTMNNTMISNFADVFVRLTAIDNNLTYVQNQITNLNDAMANNFTNVVNFINALDVNMANNFTYTNLLITTLSSDMNANFTYTNGLIQAMEQGMVSNFTDVKNMITVLDGSMASNFSYTNSMISTIETSMGANFTYTNGLILDMNSSLSVLMNRNYDLMAEVNQTSNYILTNVTYMNQYLETTLYPMVNDTNVVVNNIWSKLTGIEITVNETRVIVGQINETTTNIYNQTTQILNLQNRMRAWITN